MHARFRPQLCVCEDRIAPNSFGGVFDTHSSARLIPPAPPETELHRTLTTAPTSSGVPEEYVSLQEAETHDAETHATTEEPVTTPPPTSPPTPVDFDAPFFGEISVEIGSSAPAPTANQGAGWQPAPVREAVGMPQRDAAPVPVAPAVAGGDASERPATPVVNVPDEARPVAATPAASAGEGDIGEPDAVPLPSESLTETLQYFPIGLLLAIQQAESEDEIL